MIVNKGKIFTHHMSEYGASITEVLLAMSIVAIASPFLYKQILTASNTVADIAIANNITALRAPVLNFVRMNQGEWPETAQIRLSAEELKNISEFPKAGFIDKYTVRGAVKTDIYLAFDVNFNQLRTNQIARHIGTDAAVVSDDGIAYGASWAVTAPDFTPGDLVYKISRDIVGQDKSIYLHRGTSGEDKLNQMQRTLNMGGNNMYNVGAVTAKLIDAYNCQTNFLETENLASNSVYFSSGANLTGDDISLGNVRVNGDITGFRNITADKYNDNKYTLHGDVIADRATISDTVNVSNQMVIKSSSTRTISGFAGLTVNNLNIPYLSVTEMTFYDNFGLTVSGELMMSTVAPIKIGAWSFPSKTPPAFSQLNFVRAKIPTAPQVSEFKALIKNDWRGAASGYESETNNVLKVRSL